MYNFYKNQLGINVNPLSVGLELVPVIIQIDDDDGDGDVAGGGAYVKKMFSLIFLLISTSSLESNLRRMGRRQLLLFDWTGLAGSGTATTATAVAADLASPPHV